MPAAIVFADHDEFLEIDEPTAAFSYARLMRGQSAIKTGYKPAALDAWAKRAKTHAKRGDAFLYFIAGAKEHAPPAARALIERL